MFYIYFLFNLKYIMANQINFMTIGIKTNTKTFKIFEIDWMLNDRNQDWNRILEPCIFHLRPCVQYLIIPCKVSKSRTPIFFFLFLFLGTFKTHALQISYVGCKRKGMYWNPTYDVINENSYDAKKKKNLLL